MGINRFFYWFKNRFEPHLHKVGYNETFSQIDAIKPVDILLLDMNGIIHTSAQKIHEYGNHKRLPSLLTKCRGLDRENPLDKQKRVFSDICEEINKIVLTVEPQKKLFLAVDGVAPLSKIFQQKKRRYKAAMEMEGTNQDFDSTCITPGTKFLNFLTKYIDWYIRKKLSTDPVWQNLEIIFSNEKVCGEGEHTCMEYIRRYGTPDDTYCIVANDADLIMLTLATHLPNFYVLREDMYNSRNEYFCVDIGQGVKPELIKEMRWDEKSERKFDPVRAINDFVMVCFMAGNDFLPNVPSIEIIRSGIDVMLDVYKNVGASYGHLTRVVNGKVLFIKKPLEVYLGNIAQYEKGLFEDKLNGEIAFFPDEILNRNTTLDTENGGRIVDMKKYREDYYKTHFPDTNVKTICMNYLEGMQWVLSYYTTGVPNWRWYYPFHYAPFAHDMAQYLHMFRFPEYGKTFPITPFQQLLSVLPPRSAYLLPFPLNKLLTEPTSQLKPFCPDKIQVDLSGKQKEWEGVIILPMVDIEHVRDACFKYISQVSPEDLKRNITGKNFRYVYDSNVDSVFSSFYGNIENCRALVEPIEI